MLDGSWKKLGAPKCFHVFLFNQWEYYGESELSILCTNNVQKLINLFIKKDTAARILTLDRLYVVTVLLVVVLGEGENFYTYTHSVMCMPIRIHIEKMWKNWHAILRLINFSWLSSHDLDPGLISPQIFLFIMQDATV